MKAAQHIAMSHDYGSTLMRPERNALPFQRDGLNWAVSPRLWEDMRHLNALETVPLLFWGCNEFSGCFQHDLFLPAIRRGHSAIQVHLSRTFGKATPNYAGYIATCPLLIVQYHWFGTDGCGYCKVRVPTCLINRQCS